MSAPRHIAVIAGEASGDALGGGLIRALKAKEAGVFFSGIGGPQMRQAGLESLFPYQELSLMGFAEILPHLPNLLRRLRETEAHVVRTQPACVVTIDSPGFTFRLAKILANNPVTRHIPRIHYVAPSVWAYKPERVHQTAKLFQLLLVLLPFEPPYFTQVGLPTVFVGHPALWRQSQGNAAAFRARHGIAPEQKLLLLLPGSRMGEVKRHLSLFLEAARALPDHTPVILASPAVAHWVHAQAPGTIVTETDARDDVFASADLALSKSGTVTLELAVAGVPMVVAHRMHPVSAWLIRRMIKIPYVSLVNIAQSRMIVPEFLQERCTLPFLEQALAALCPPEARARQRLDLEDAIARLKGEMRMPPSDAAAVAVLDALTGAPRA